MSVINKMLQDLDKRQQGHGLNPGIAPVLQYRSPARSKMPMLLGCIASVLLGAALLWGWQRLSLGTTFIAPESQQQASQRHVQQDSGAPGSIETHAVETGPAETDSAAANPDESKPGAERVAPRVDVAKASTAEMPSAPARMAASKAPALEPQAVESGLAEFEPAKPDLLTTEPATTESAVAAPVLVEPVAPESVYESAPVAPSLQITEVRLTSAQLAAKRLVKAEEAERQGRLAEAVALYRETLRLDDGAHQARRQLAALFYGQDRLAQAAQLLEEGSLAYPQEFDLSLLLAKVQRAQGLTEAALATLDKIPDSGKLAADKWILTGELAKAQGQWQRAEAAYRLLTRLEPGQARWWMGLGFALDSRAQYPDAIRAYQMALSQSGLSTDARKYIDNRLLQLATVVTSGPIGERE